MTDDSDVFLFGARSVYRGVFDQYSSTVRRYYINHFREELGLNRNKLICLALFLGSDYTLGIKGVGPVNAMEILGVFETIEDLRRFREWANHADILLDDAEQFYIGVSEREK